MRSALLLGLALLFLGLCDLALSGLARLRAGEPGGTLDAVTILAAAKGRMLSPGQFGADPIANAIHVGDATLRLDAALAGLRVVELGPDLTVASHQNYDTASSPEDARAFARGCDGSAPGTVLVIASQKEIRPADAEEARALAQVADSLGSSLDPFADPRVSWALVTVRLPEGWARIAESFSTEKGVVLCCTLSRDLEWHARHAGETLVETSGTRELMLAQELTEASERVGGVSLRWLDAGEGRRELALAFALVPPIEGRRPRPARVRWQDLELGAQPRFDCTTGLRSEDVDAIYELWVDGEVVATRSSRESKAASATLVRTWDPWEVDLSRFAGSTVELALQVTADPRSRATRATRDDAFASVGWALWLAPRVTSRTR